MLRVLPAVIEIGLLLYCLIDCIQAPDGTVRNLPKWGWIVLIVLVPWIGPVAYLIAGRPRREGVTSGAPWSPPGRPDGRTSRPAPRAPRGPDDDPDFLRDLNRQRREAPEGTGGAEGTEGTEGDPEPPAATS
jgi:hypothetical protein